MVQIQRALVCAVHKITTNWNLVFEFNWVGLYLYFFPFWISCWSSLRPLAFRLLVRQRRRCVLMLSFITIPEIIFSYIAAVWLSFITTFQHDWKQNKEFSHAWIFVSFPGAAVNGLSFSCCWSPTFTFASSLQMIWRQWNDIFFCCSPIFFQS